MRTEDTERERYYRAAYDVSDKAQYGEMRDELRPWDFEK